LRNVIERSVILTDGATFSIDEAWLRRNAGPRPPVAGDGERQKIEAALAASKGRVSGPHGAAILLGIPRQTLESRIRALRINKHQLKAGLILPGNCRAIARSPPRASTARSQHGGLPIAVQIRMPMIDVYAAADLFPRDADRKLAEELTAALLKAEGVEKPGPTHLNNTGAYIHRMPASAVNTPAGEARTVRVQVLTPRGVLERAGQKQLVTEVTQIVAKISGDPTQAGRTWVPLTEAAEGGWGIAGTAFGKEEFAALAARRK
jgi:phenylpyruvate tautomerase PptA (4-oxalocrotonate tautomerase family)